VPFRFKHHYTIAEARELLPKVSQWLVKARKAREDYLRLEDRVGGLLRGGADVGGDLANRWVRALADLRDILREFHSREIEVKDLDRGLVDFPGIVGGKEVFLCWEEGEEDIEFWHDLESGYAGRTRLE